MRFIYRNPETGNLFEYASEDERQQWGDENLVRLSDEEVEEVTALPVALEDLSDSAGKE